MALRVSVIVATYNSGHRLEATIDSVRRQSLGPAAVELVLVDDGSTDGTAARVRALAGVEPWVVAREITNSGWPSRPRNVGLKIARGEYVLFMDHDDELYPRALEYLVDLGDAAGSDIVVGKEVRTGGRTMGLETFRADARSVDLLGGRIMDVPTPHKLFRRAFLQRNAIAFPEEQRRLEDHFLLAAANRYRPVISVLASKPCYRWIIHPDNNSRQVPDPHAYYHALESVLAQVDRWPSEPARHEAYRFWYRSCVLERFGPGGFRTWPQDVQPAWFDRARRMAEDRFDPALDREQEPAMRARAALLRAGDRPGIVRYSESERHVTTRPELDEVACEDGALLLTVRARLEGAGGPVRFERDTDGRTLQRPATALPPGVADWALDVTDSLGRARVDLVLTERSTNAEWFVPTQVTAALVPVGDAEAWTLEAVGRIDPATALMGAPLGAGIWDVRMRTAALGYDSRPTVRTADCVLPPPLEFGGRRGQPYPTKSGRLAIKVSNLPRAVSPPAGDRRSTPVGVAARTAGGQPGGRWVGLGRALLTRAVAGRPDRRPARPPAGQQSGEGSPGPVTK